MSVRSVCVLISGSGTNLQALIDARASGRLPIEFLRVISDRPGAPGLQRAERAGIATTVLEPARFEDHAAFDHALALAIGSGSPDLVVLAGFMRIVGPAVLERFAARMINLHPSLLPRHRGTDTYRRALAAGDSEHGASVHFVTAELDGGPVIAQVRIPIDNGDDAGRLAARLGPREHALIVATVELFTRHSVQCAHGRITIDGNPLQQPLQLGPDGHLHP